MDTQKVDNKGFVIGWKKKIKLNADELFEEISYGHSKLS